VILILLTLDITKYFYILIFYIFKYQQISYLISSINIPNVIFFHKYIRAFLQAQSLPVNFLNILFVRKLN